MKQDRLHFAEQHRAKMQKHIDAVSKQLTNHFGEEVFVFYQPGDGFVLNWHDSRNCPVSSSTIDKFLSMTREEIFSYLNVNSI